MPGRLCLRMHRPSLLKRADGRFEVHYEECLARFDEAPPIGIGIPVVREHEAVGLLCTHRRQKSVVGMRRRA